VYVVSVNSIGGYDFMGGIKVFGDGYISCIGMYILTQSNTFQYIFSYSMLDYGIYYTLSGIV